MTDRIFLRLSEKYALGADDLQWILYRAARDVPLDEPLALGRNGPWRGVSFVRSAKAILHRCMREKGCNPLREAQLALDAMPDTFDEWKAPASPRVDALEALP